MAESSCTRASYIVARCFALPPPVAGLYDRRQRNSCPSCKTPPHELLRDGLCCRPRLSSPRRQILPTCYNQAEAEPPSPCAPAPRTAAGARPYDCRRTRFTATVIKGVWRPPHTDPQHARTCPLRRRSIDSTGIQTAQRPSRAGKAEGGRWRYGRRVSPCAAYSRHNHIVAGR